MHRAVEQQPRARSGAWPAGKEDLRGSRERTVHDAGRRPPGHGRRFADAKGSSALAADLRQHAAEPDLQLREELTLSKIDHYTEAVDELDVEGILAFAERILPRASDLWVQESLDYKQWLQQLFFPEGIAYDGNRFNRTAATALLLKYLEAAERGEENLASLTFASWNAVVSWLRQVERLRFAA